LSFSETLGGFAKKLQGNGFANDIGLPTLLFDLASVSSNDKNWVGDAFNIAGDTFRSSVLAASFPIRKASGFAIQKALLPAAQLSYETGGRYLREPLSAALTTLATGDVKKSWENRDEISPGQALAYLQSRFPVTGNAVMGFDEGFDIFNPNDRKDFETDWNLRTITGAYDTFFTTVTDPLGKIGKAAGLARKALVTRPMGAVDANASTLARDFFMPKSIRKTTIISPETLARTINEGREEGGELYNTLSWFAKSDQVSSRSHPTVELSNDADTLSYLLGEAKTVDDVADTFMATALKDKEAMARLVAKRKDLAFVMDKIKDTSTTELNMLDNIPTNGIVDDINKLDSADALVKNLDEDVYFRYLTTLNDKGADLTKRTFGASPFEKMAINRAERRAAGIRGKVDDIDSPTSFPTVGYFQPTKYHPLVAVVNFGVKKVGDAFQEKPAGYINLNDSDSYNEIAAFGNLLRRVVGDEANPIVQRHLNDYIQSGGTPELRARVVESFEDLAITSINRKLGISDEAGAQIWGAYKSRRETARSMIKDRKFLMTNDDVILKIPYLERQGANALPMVDLENYERVLMKNKGLLKALEGGFDVVDPDSWRYTTGIMNDMWKASVLLRLGYTVRNVSEGALSIMAKGYGLMALGDLNREGFDAWYSNRVRDIERITDRRLVSQGAREDSIQLRRLFAEKQYEFGAADRMYNELLAYLPAAERAFLNGKLDEAQLKEIIDVFQYATGEYLYHGTPTPINGLDNTRPFAMSLSQDIANRYADAAMPTVSAADIYKRMTGRAGRLPKNIERSAADEIGSEAIIDRLSEDEFLELTEYVAGNFQDIQAGLRDANFAISRGRNIPELPKTLQRTIQRSVLKEPLTVYRGTTNPRNIFANAQVGDIIEEPAFVSTSYSDDVARNFATPNPLNKIPTLNTNLKPGEDMFIPGEETISTQIKMKLPKGLNGLDVGATYQDFSNKTGTQISRETLMMVNRESEVLLPAGTKFRVISRGGNVDSGFVVTVEAILPKAAPKQKPSLAMETIGADMRDGFINTVNNGNQVELLNPQTGQWRTIDPNTVSQKMLVQGTFRIRKPGNQGAVLGNKVYGESIDLRLFQGNRAKLGLKDYPELQKILGVGETAGWKTRAAWEGKEDQLLGWMRANGVGKLVLPDTKANGNATVLVDPEMVEAFGEQPAVLLAEKRLNAIKNQQQLLSDESRVAKLIEDTIKNGGATVSFTGDVPTSGFSVAIRGATHTFSVEDARNNPQAWIDSMAEHFEKNLEKFGTADHFGTWVQDIDGVPHIWADPTNVIVDKAKAAKLGLERNQVEVADLAAIQKGDWDNAMINTKGTGDKNASAEFALGQGTKASIGNVPGGTQGVRRVIGTEGFGKRIDELEAILSTRKYPTDGLVSLVREFADGQAAAKRDMNGLLSRLDARLVEEGRIAAPRQIQGTGRRTERLYDGSMVEFDDSFRGEGGAILLSQTDNAQTYRNFVDHPSQLFAAEHSNFTEARLTAKMPEYYTGYANQLNSFFRSPDGRIDPIVEMFLNGMKPEQAVAWLRKPENVAYARKFNIDVPGIKVMSERLNVSMDAEDFVGDLYSAYQRYLPDNEVQEAFRAGDATEQWLRTHFTDNPNMPDIIGRIVPTSQEARTWQEGMSKVVERAFHFLGSLPETTVARHPLARQIYRAEYKNRLDIALATKRLNEGDAAELTVDDINNLRGQVIEATRKEVNSTLFTIIRKSYAGEKMRFIMPFFNAWENTIRRWYGLTKDNPAVVARAGQVISSLRNQPNVVDQDGNQTTEFSYDNKIVLPMPEGAIKTVSMIPGWGKGMAEALRSSGTQMSIPIRSLDILFQGEAIAGFGPIVTMPVNEIVKIKPDLEDLVTSTVLPVLPFGPQEGFLRQLFPPAAQKLISLRGQDEAWSRTFNTVYRYELIRFNLGERNTLPELGEIKTMADNLYKVKMLSNLVMPFAAQYDSTLSFYTQQFRRLQQVYGQDAEALFLEMYPEMSPALISASYNPTGVNASQAAFKNTQKYSGLISKIGQTTPEMIGFLVNDPDGKYDFSEAVYAWQYGNAPVPGSTENYRGRRNPADLKKDANVKMGWIEFRKNMNLLDSQLFAQGYTSFNDNGAEELQTLKQMMVADMTSRNKDWAADYYSVDRGKWIYRMQSMTTMLSDPTWMKENGNRPVVQSIAVYLNLRSQIARELASRKAYGMSSTLTAKDNSDLDGLWNQTIAQLLQGSGEFEDFYNRFLQNDPVTLG
jgi:hypothetical protein